MTTTYTNRNGDTVTTALTREQLIEDFAKNAPADHWMFFWMAKYSEADRATNSTTESRKDMTAFIADLFLYALGMGLKRPMIRLHFKGRRYKVYLSKRGSICFKSGRLVPVMVKNLDNNQMQPARWHKCSISHPDTCRGCTDDETKVGQVFYSSDPDGDEEYMGCMFQGRFLPGKDDNRVERKLLPEEQEFFANMNSDPVGFMAKCSKDMNRCCYCNAPLEDARSKDVGYGPVCAVHWGLPWGKSYDEKVPSFADLWGKASTDDQRSIRGLCEAIRKEPYAPDLWEILGDVLEQAGFAKRPAPPKPGVTIPAA